VASPGVTLPVGSVSIQYLSNDVAVAGVQESDLRLYYWDGAQWLELNTVLDTYFNLASAPSQGEGIYALMASVTIPLYGPGWNLIAYPVQVTRTVTEALLSISGVYTTVYGYEPTDPDGDVWKVYDVGVPDWVNDLHELVFGKGYWINVSEEITLYLNGGASVMVSGPLAPAMALPPSTFYGAVQSSEWFTPAPGMLVTARIDGHLCGQARTRQVGDQVVYVIDVLAEGNGQAVGCGAAGRTVTFEFDDRWMSASVPWDNHHLWELILNPNLVVFLPLIGR
jgi:hypothetical protein